MSWLIVAATLGPVVFAEVVLHDGAMRPAAIAFQCVDFSIGTVALGEDHIDGRAVLRIEIHAAQSNRVFQMTCVACAHDHPGDQRLVQHVT